MTEAGFALDIDADLGAANTFRVAARAPILARLHRVDALPTLLEAPPVRDRPLLLLGEGSNLLFAGDAEAVVLRPELRGIEIVDDDGESAGVRAAAGEHWDALVDWTLQRGLYGLENLALIPGSVGAAPVQNIGAYGRELDTVFGRLEAFDRVSGRFETMTASECGFRYRASRFRDEAPDRWIIVSLTLRLSRRPEPRLDYPGVRESLASTGAAEPTPLAVAEAVRRLRRAKLPDPMKVGNAGSFFKNPVLASATADALAERLPGLVRYPVDAGLVKVPAAALIEAAGLKGRRRGAAGVSERHALVLVNHGGASGAEVLALAREVRDTVRERFGVTLEPEPRIVGSPGIGD